MEGLENYITLHLGFTALFSIAFTYKSRPVYTKKQDTLWRYNAGSWLDGFNKIKEYTVKSAMDIVTNKVIGMEE